MNYEFKCYDCEVVTIESYRYEDRPSKIECPMCGLMTAQYIISTPGLTKASYIDGTKRFSDAKEAARLNKQMAAQKDKTTKKEMAAEIRKIGYKFEK